MRKIPTLDPLLVEVLNERVPEKCPDPAWTDREIWIYAGKRELVKMLMAELNAQSNETIL